MEKFEIVKAKDDFCKRLDAIKKVIDFDNLNIKIKKLETKMLADDFWSDQKNASKIINECNELKENLKTYEKLVSDLEEISLVLELEDEELYLVVEDNINNLEKHLKMFENELLLNGEFDKKNAILELHPGAGGTESQDWALMLYRMYKRYAERHNFKFELIDYQEGNEAGIKSVTFSIIGKNAYGMLKGEGGVHRLVRISPFDSSKRRHTSFASVDVSPVFEDIGDVTILDEDIRIDTYRASGAGGQHINKTDSAVRITHIPTGIVVSCQTERSQIQNRERCMNMLKSKLYQLEMEKKQKELQEIKGEQKLIEWGSQIRSYVFCPYNLVKDHLTNYETSDVEGVMNGDIKDFIYAYLKMGVKQND